MSSFKNPKDDEPTQGTVSLETDKLSVDWKRNDSAWTQSGPHLVDSRSHRKPLFVNTSGKALLDLKEASLITGISSWTLRKDITAKKLACIRRGGRRGKILISPGDLEAYLNRYRLSAIGE